MATEEQLQAWKEAASRIGEEVVFDIIQEYEDLQERNSEAIKALTKVEPVLVTVCEMASVQKNTDLLHNVRYLLKEAEQ